MPTPKEYSEFMAEALGWARTARTEEERERWLDLARTWHDAALRWEKSLGRVEESAERVARAKPLS